MDFADPCFSGLGDNAKWHPKEQLLVSSRFLKRRHGKDPRKSDKRPYLAGLARYPPILLAIGTESCNSVKNSINCLYWLDADVRGTLVKALVLGMCVDTLALSRQLAQMILQFASNSDILWFQNSNYNAITNMWRNFKNSTNGVLWLLFPGLYFCKF